MRSLAIIGLCVLLGACGEDDASANGVGLRTLIVTDSSRVDPGGTGAERSWAVDVFYPSNGGGEPVAYAPSEEWSVALVSSAYYGQDDAVLQGWADRDGPANRDAVLAAGIARPLLLLSPGLGMARINYRDLAADLVAAGFVVAVIDHPYLGLSIDSEGRVTGPGDLPGLADAGPDDMGPFVADWTDDLTVSLDALLSEAGQLGIDPERVAAAGHSLGGTIALDACGQDARITACLNFEGAPFGSQTLETGPGGATLMVLSAPRYEGAEAEARAERGAGIRGMNLAMLSQGEAPAWFVTVEGGAHLSFSDAPYVMPGTLTVFGGEVMTPDRAFDVYTGLVVAFTQAYWPGGGGDADFAAALETLPEAEGWQAE